ncbi:hypothetical protein ADUPG1_004760, partial [Aduncisulcus paluster]
MYNLWCWQYSGYKPIRIHSMDKRQESATAYGYGRRLSRFNGIRRRFYSIGMCRVKKKPY